MEGRKRFEGRVMLVTGATSGIGRCCARRLAEEGAKVVAAGRRRDRLEALEEEVTAAGGQLLGVPGDVRDEATCRSWVAAAVGRFGGLDGRALRELLESSGATVMQATPATWQMLLDSGWEGQSGLRLFCGGEALTRRLANSLVNSAAEVWNLYGPTETTVWSTVPSWIVSSAIISFCGFKKITRNCSSVSPPMEVRQ
mgnify:CR=1 FL=1